MRRAGVSVETMTWSTSAAVRPASASAALQATTARSVSVRLPLRWRRSRMPVRRTIHSSVVSRYASKSAFVTIVSGSAEPMPKTPAFMSGGRPQGPLDEAGQDRAGSALDKVRCAHRLQFEQRLAPAHGLEQVLGELGAD